MKNRRSPASGICAFVAVLALSLPAAAAAWKCQCDVTATYPTEPTNLAWLNFTHSETFDLIGYSGTDHQEAIKRCGARVVQETKNFNFEIMLTYAAQHVMSPRQSAYDSLKKSWCSASGKAEAAKVAEETGYVLRCRAYDSPLGNTQASSGITVSSGHLEASVITCGN
jgi:hypothetical protein